MLTKVLVVSLLCLMVVSTRMTSFERKKTPLSTNECDIMHSGYNDLSFDHISNMMYYSLIFPWQVSNDIGSLLDDLFCPQYPDTEEEEFNIRLGILFYRIPIIGTIFWFL